MQYRSDIDGLRALAVTSVVAYHLDTPQVTGGFVGVDVFFVISGFLITSLIVGELAEGRFTITDFYRRRLRRIVPALLTVLLVTCGGASFLLFDRELDQLASSAVWAGLFSSNVYFWRHADYFDTPATSQPLLHTWSLGVEEQFYLFFPLVLLLVHRYARRHLALVLAGIGVASFLLGWHQVRTGDSGDGFYLLPGRAWELGLGALLAVTALRLPRLLRHAGSLLGLLLIAYACHHYTSTTVFPGPAALLPVVGAALLIAAGGDAVVNRVLSWRPIVLVGLLSYSWYLWHWPAIVLYRLYTFSAITWTSRIALAALTLALSVLSWRFVERPLRTLRLPDRRHVVGFAAMTSAAVVLLGLAVQPFSRVVHAPDATTQAYLREAGRPPRGVNRDDVCFVSSRYDASRFDHATCTTPTAGKKSVLLVGDSHAADLWYGLDHGLPDVEVLQATASGCKPVLPITGEARCVEVVTAELTRLRTAQVDALVVSGRWRDDDVPKLARTITAYRALAPRVVVVGVSPEWFGDVPALLARARDTDDAALLDKRMDRRVYALDRRMRRVVEAAGGVYVSLVDALCTGTGCRYLTPDGEPMAFDYGHFTREGSVIATAPVVDVLSKALATAR